MLPKRKFGHEIRLARGYVWSPESFACQKNPSLLESASNKYNRLFAVECPGGGIGRHKRLKISWEFFPVPVQVRPWAQKASHLRGFFVLSLFKARKSLAEVC
tara:strand:- start:125 stop:430 length:306 start_codon:yes stop_codon:yes gene_type:complete